MSQDRTDSLLRRALLGNAAFSAVSGLALALGGSALGPVIGAPGALLHVLGVILLGYGASLLMAARRSELRLAEAWFAVAADSGWVLGAAALIAIGGILTPIGVGMLAAVTALVLGFAVAQWRGIQRLAPA